LADPNDVQFEWDVTTTTTTTTRLLLLPALTMLSLQKNSERSELRYKGESFIIIIYWKKQVTNVHA